MKRVTPGMRTVRRARSCFASHAASASRPAPARRVPASGRTSVVVTPATNTQATTTNWRRFETVSCPSRASSRRSPATVRTRKAASHGSASATGRPAASSTAATGQAPAPAAWTPRWRDRSRVAKTTYVPTRNRPPATRSHEATSGDTPRTVSAAPMPAVTGAAYPSGLPRATARSRAMTVPRNPRVINRPCPAARRPASAGIGVPTRTSAPARPARSASPPSASSRNRAPGGCAACNVRPSSPARPGRRRTSASETRRVRG